MKRRDRIIDALNFKETEKVPKDLGGMRSSSVSCFQYSKLRDYLGLREGLPLIYDTFQMLAMPEPDVLDALDCDVVFVDGRYSNAFDERGKFTYYDFNGRLPAMVDDPSLYKVHEDGTITRDDMSMPPASTVFDAPHGGHALDLNNIIMPPLEELRQELENSMLSDREVEDLALLCRKVRESTDRAVFLTGYNVNLNFIGGIANGSMLCVLEPEYVKSYNSMKAEYIARRFEKIIPAVGENIDLVLSGNEDMGTQNTTIISPDLIDEMILPYFKIVNDAVHGANPSMKTFLHSCGAIYDIIDGIIDAGFDIMNPVQWTAGGHSYREWKDKARNRITLWGGGVDSQHLLPLGSIEDIEKQVGEVVPYMKKDGGFVFCNIHNLTADINPEKIAAIYKKAGTL